jgi:hypothetical protein
MDEIDTRFAYIEHDGKKFQVLKYDENKEPYDWDEQETARMYNEWLNQQ